MKIIRPTGEVASVKRALLDFQQAGKVLALTGAGISVGSGIPDFRSPGGLWSRFSPDQYATVDVFRRDPQKAWKLYRAMGKIMYGARANAAHEVLASLERDGLVDGIITQNVDNLHQQAGSQKIYEIHGDHQHLQCSSCDRVTPVQKEHYDTDSIPTCSVCHIPLKPNVVLFGEDVRALDLILEAVDDCDLLLVIGTSCQVYPAARLPALVKGNGGMIFEFNQQQCLCNTQPMGSASMSDYFFEGDVIRTLPYFYKSILKIMREGAER